MTSISFFGASSAAQAGNRPIFLGTATPATHWELSADGLYLRARDRTAFDIIPARDVSSFGTNGWTGWSESGADLTGSGLNKCFESGGTARLYAKDLTSGSWGSTTRDAPRWGKTYVHRAGNRFYFCVDVNTIPAGIGGVIVWLDALEASTNSLSVGMSGNNTSIRRIRPGSAVDTVGAVGLGTPIAWFRLTFDQNLVVVDVSAGTTRPTTEAGWTYVATVDNLFTGSGLGTTTFRPRLNIARASINASSAYTGYYIDFHGWDDTEMTGVQWAATKKETSAQVQTLPEVDLGSTSAVWSDALARAWASRVTNKRAVDSAAVEWRMTRGSSGLSGTGSWYAAGSIVVQGSGRYLLPEVRYTSDGATTASIRLDVPIIPT